jgi:hypothetical protein
MLERTLTIGEIATALECDERTARKYLHEVDTAISVDAQDSDEKMKRRTVIDLAAAHAGDEVGKRLIRLLGRTGSLDRGK